MQPKGSRVLSSCPKAALNARDALVTRSRTSFGVVVIMLAKEMTPLLPSRVGGLCGMKPVPGRWPKSARKKAPTQDKGCYAAGETLQPAQASLLLRLFS